tara:strand:+ start:1980 stop:2366 length:387 start_codon:yes stop_codon:yes gene_type:complete
MTHASASPTAVIKAFLAAMAVKDYDAALPLVSGICEYDNGPLGVVHGPEGVRAVLEPFFAPTLENEFIIKREVADGHTVFVERLDRHLLPTGWVELPVTGVFEVHEGQITVWHDYFDANTIISKWPTA